MVSFRTTIRLFPGLVIPLLFLTFQSYFLSEDPIHVFSSYSDGGGVPGDARRREGCGVRTHLLLAHAVRGHGQVHPPLQLPILYVLLSIALCIPLYLQNLRLLGGSCLSPVLMITHLRWGILLAIQ